MKFAVEWSNFNMRTPSFKEHHQRHKALCLSLCETNASSNNKIYFLRSDVCNSLETLVELLQVECMSYYYYYYMIMYHMSSDYSYQYMSDSDLWVTGFFIVTFMLFGIFFLISSTICESPHPFFFLTK